VQETVVPGEEGGNHLNGKYYIERYKYVDKKRLQYLDGDLT
jgi:hypothetical protein